MENRPQTSAWTKLSHALAISAFVAWVVSLGLPGFTAGGETWAGGPILGYGLVFGWLCHGWAAYANLFFLIALSRFAMGRIPTITLVLTLTLAATFPMFDALPRGESGGSTPIQSWEAGVAVWFLSFVLLTAAVLVRVFQLKGKPEHAL